MTEQINKNDSEHDTSRYVKVRIDHAARQIDVLKQFKAFQKSATKEEWDNFNKICDRDEHWVKTAKNYKWTHQAVLEYYKDIV